VLAANDLGRDLQLGLERLVSRFLLTGQLAKLEQLMMGIIALHHLNNTFRIS
jgi:hypothetical protein